MTTISRFGKLGGVFKDGKSELFNGIARLSVLYEDLRLEMGEFRQLRAVLAESGCTAIDYRTMYYLRRSLSTLVEFRGALTTIRRSGEFKQAEASLSATDAGYIVEADTYLHRNWAQIRDLRNEFGAHIKLRAVKYTLSNCDDLVGRVTVREVSRWLDGPGLECHYAGDLVAGAISSKLQSGTEIRAELRNALQVVAVGFRHAQLATLALIHAFVWDRFGA